MIKYFRGKYHFLSNFYKHPVTFKGIEFHTSEAAYQASKAVDEETFNKFIDIEDPKEARKLGHQIQVRADWEDIKFDVMREVLAAKFSDSELKKMLLETGDEELQETCYWYEPVWGVYEPMCKNPKNPPGGENWLGRLLMELREELKKAA